MGNFLKCDTAGCDHIEDVDQIAPELIGKPCPRCGASLLTAEDCANWQANVLPGIELARALGLLVDPTAAQAEMPRLRIGLHQDTLTVKAVPGAGAAPTKED